MLHNKKEQKTSELDPNLGDRNKKTKPSALKRVVIILAGLLFMVILFNVAMIIIGIKTNYLHRWAGEQYFGGIVEINDSSFIIKGRSNERWTILVTDRTIIKKGTKTVKDTLQIGDRVIVIGPLNKEGQIESQLIRVFDPGDPIDPQKFFQPPFLR